jgi:hypothetical protein
MFVNINGKSDLVRDLESGAIVNVSSTEYENYMNNRKRNSHLQQQIKQQDVEIQEIKDDIKDIKQLLLKLLEAEK